MVLFSTVWAMTPGMFETLVSIVDRDNLSPEAVAAQLGRPLDNAHTVTLRDAVAVIPIDGPIVRRADMFSAISGATALATLATDLRAALDNPSVTSILLQIDSPGGDANGVGEFAAMVREAGARKRIVAYIGGTGASAAYWIAAAAAEVVVASTALVGASGCWPGSPTPISAPGARSSS